MAKKGKPKAVRKTGPGGKHALRIATPAGKIPSSVADPDSFRQLSPSWRFSVFDWESDLWGRSSIENDGLDIQGLSQILRDRETQTWNELLGGPGNHPIPVGHLSKAARDRLEEIHQDEVDSLISLRITGCKRLWGIRSGAVLRLLWWDPNHQVCPSNKKHT